MNDSRCARHGGALHSHAGPGLACAWAWDKLQATRHYMIRVATRRDSGYGFSLSRGEVNALLGIGEMTAYGNWKKVESGKRVHPLAEELASGLLIP